VNLLGSFILRMIIWTELMTLPSSTQCCECIKWSKLLSHQQNMRCRKKVTGIHFVKILLKRLIYLTKHYLMHLLKPVNRHMYSIRVVNLSQNAVLKKILKILQAVKASGLTNLYIVYLTTPKCLDSQKSKFSERTRRSTSSCFKSI